MKSKYRDALIDLLVRVLPIILLIFAYLFFIKRELFWKWTSIIFFALLIIWVAIVIYKQIKRKRFNGILKKIETLRLDEYIKNFINRFGHGGKGSPEYEYVYRGYTFEKHRLDDFYGLLKEKILSLEWDDMWNIILNYIDEQEERLTRESVGTHQYKFSELGGTDFEILISRLFEKMGYAVQHTGKSGDQGGDLVANKGGERILIQAKRWEGSVGNIAVQQAVAAQKFYDCNRVIVVATSSFTQEAIELAKANNVELISRERLQEILLTYLKESWD